MRTITIEISKCQDCKHLNCEKRQQCGGIPDDCPIWTAVEDAKKTCAEKIQYVANSGISSEYNNGNVMEIKPCPQCGYKCPDIINTHNRMYIIACPKCHYGTINLTPRRHLSEAIELWNTIERKS